MKWAALAVALKRTDRLLKHAAAWSSAGPSPPECCRSFWCVVDGVNGGAVLQTEFPIRNTDKVRVLGAGFCAQSMGGVWTGKVLAVDSEHFGQSNPGSAVENALKYYVRDAQGLLRAALHRWLSR